MANDPPSATAQEITIDEKGDVILVVGKDPHQGRIQVSTMLLAMYSSVFRTIFQGPWKEAVHFALAVKSQNPYQLELPEDLFEPTTFLCEILYHQAVMPKAIHHSTSASKEVCDEQLETAEREAERMASFITYLPQLLDDQQFRAIPKTEQVSSAVYWFSAKHCKDSSIRQRVTIWFEGEGTSW
ncbi:hypothetical protein BT63DRAFT_412216 [Microthyrium microscopicum]|uniref:Uncharacterized protein n=1 Tax=Microthyrium microscopicum TaxID=703497 RepID=A0A6A6UJU4_9PEZI|nr:hypothetical protein BT63DRAFT_412216 [Microthyrium microscopicum]